MNNDQHGIRARGSGDGAGIKCVGASTSGPSTTGKPWYRWLLWRLAWARKDALPYQDFLLLGHGEEWRRLCGRLWVRAH